MSNGVMLDVRRICKSYSGVQVLFDVDLAVARGEIHGLVGENGAGKSTLLKIIASVISKDAGDIRIEGKPYHPEHLIDAFRSGISIVYQESTLIPNLSVAENIFIGQLNEYYRGGYLNRGRLVDQANRVFEQKIGYRLDTSRPASTYDFGERTLIEIARALAYEPKVLLLDEVTTSLDLDRVQLMMKLIREFRDGGGTVIYISHRLEEIFEICGRITVLRDGRVVGEVDPTTTDEGGISAMMVGRDISTLRAGSRTTALVDRSECNKVLEVRNLRVGGACREFSFELYRGEIVGLAGLGGCGSEEVLQAVFGAVPITAGEILIKGQPIRNRSIGEIRRMRVAYIPKERLLQGLITNFSIRDNLALSNLDKFKALGGLCLDIKKIEEFSREGIAKFNIRAAGPGTQVASLSGGNQQKVMIAKWISSGADILLLNNPSRGVDVGVKYEIYNLIDELRSGGIAILLTSEELPEIIRLCDRVICVKHGEAVGCLDREDGLTEEKIVTQMF